MRAIVGQAIALWGTLGLACSAPAVDVPAARGALLVSFEPAAEAQVLPANVRARVHGAKAATPWLFRGELSQQYDRALRAAELPAALRERAVPLRFWSEQADTWLQPLAWLEAGEHYTLALLNHGAVQGWDIAFDTTARAEQLFPARGRPVQRVSVQCSPSFSELTGSLQLAPGDTAVRVSFDTPRLRGTTCITLQADQQLHEPGVLPPSLGGVLLVPQAFRQLDEPPRMTQENCAGQVVFDSCLETLDDRVLVTALSHDTLWLIEAPEPHVVVSTAGTRTTLLRALLPETTVSLRGNALSSNGLSEAILLDLTTLPARRHLALTEVLANPLGPEPESEWIELVNDSDDPVELGGLWLEDAASKNELPHAVLAAGETVLLVSASFRPSALDVPIAQGTRSLELESLGARGLSNSGEALLLVGPEGIVARFPALAAAHAGRSIARRSLDAEDHDPTVFAEHGTPGASPGAPNTFD
jgi:hypothetical protein